MSRSFTPLLARTVTALRHLPRIGRLDWQEKTQKILQIPANLPPSACGLTNSRRYDAYVMAMAKEQRMFDEYCNKKEAIERRVYQMPRFYLIRKINHRRFMIIIRRISASTNKERQKRMVTNDGEAASTYIQLYNKHSMGIPSSIS